MNPPVAANAVLRFVLELCMLAAFAYPGSRTSDSTVPNVIPAIVVPLAAAGEPGLAIASAGTAAVNTTLVHLNGEI